MATDLLIWPYRNASSNVPLGKAFKCSRQITNDISTYHVENQNYPAGLLCKTPPLPIFLSFQVFQRNQHVKKKKSNFRPEEDLFLSTCWVALLEKR